MKIREKSVEMMWRFDKSQIQADSAYGKSNWQA